MLKEWRLASGLSVPEINARSGVSTSSWYDAEADEEKILRRARAIYGAVGAQVLLVPPRVGSLSIEAIELVSSTQLDALARYARQMVDGAAPGASGTVATILFNWALRAADPSSELALQVEALQVAILSG